MKRLIPLIFALVLSGCIGVNSSGRLRETDRGTNKTEIQQQDQLSQATSKPMVQTGDIAEGASVSIEIPKEYYEYLLKCRQDTINQTRQFDAEEDESWARSLESSFKKSSGLYYIMFALSFAIISGVCYMLYNWLKNTVVGRALSPVGEHIVTKLETLSPDSAEHRAYKDVQSLVNWHKPTR